MFIVNVRVCHCCQVVHGGSLISIVLSVKDTVRSSVLLIGYRDWVAAVINGRVNGRGHGILVGVRAPAGRLSLAGWQCHCCTTRRIHRSNRLCCSSSSCCHQSVRERVRLRTAARFSGGHKPFEIQLLHMILDIYCSVWLSGSLSASLVIVGRDILPEADQV